MYTVGYPGRRTHSRAVPHARRFVLALGATALLIAGSTMISCQQHVEEPPAHAGGTVIETPAGDLGIDALVRDDDRRIVRAQVQAPWGARDLAVYAADAPKLAAGFTAELTASQGTSFRLSIAWDPDIPGRAWVREESGGDVLTISTERRGDRILETYDMNGDVLQVDYPALDLETRRKVLAHAGQGWTPERADDIELVAASREYQAFYDRHKSASLFGNPDGEVLVSLVTSEQFVSMAVGRPGNAGPEKLADRRADRLCAIATVCGFLKCTLGGGLLNPVCVACTGTSLACAFAELGCWIVQCYW